MKQWRCRFCSHIYNEAEGDPERGVAAGTKFEDLPADWFCPDCGAGREDYEVVD